METFFTGLNTLVSSTFAIMTFRHFRVQRRPFLLVWSIGLTSYAISAGCELVLTIVGQWTTSLYITWYLTGAMLGAVYFGQGTAYFLLSRRRAHLFMALVLLVSVYGIYLTLITPLNLSAVYPAIPSGAGYPAIGEAGFDTPRWLTPFLNTYGFLWLNGGAVYSAIQLARKRMEKHRVMANVLIAAGGTLVGIISTLNRLGYHQFQYVGETIGIVLMFSGFLVSTKRTPVSVQGHIMAEPSA